MKHINHYCIGSQFSEPLEIRPSCVESRGGRVIMSATHEPPHVDARRPQQCRGDLFIAYFGQG